jgi:hypothetical protein
MVLETDWWRRLRLPAGSVCYILLGQLTRKLCEIFDEFFKLSGLVLIQILFIK